MSVGARLTMVSVVETSAFTFTSHLLLILPEAFLCWQHSLAEGDNGFQAVSRFTFPWIVIDVNGFFQFRIQGLLCDSKDVLCQFLCCHRFTSSGGTSTTLISASPSSITLRLDIPISVRYFCV